MNLKYLLQYEIINLNARRSYSKSGSKDYFEYITKKNEAFANNSAIKIYINKMENRITFKMKTAYYLELLTTEMIKLLGSTENEIIKDKTGENIH